MPIQFTLVPRGAFPDELPTVTASDLHTLRAEVRRPSRPEGQAFRQAAVLLDGGVRL